MKKLPAIDLKDISIFPTVEVPLIIRSQDSIDIIKQNDHIIVTKGSSDYGVECRISQYIELDDGSLKVELKGVSACSIISEMGDEVGYETISKSLKLSTKTDEQILNLVGFVAGIVAADKYEMEQVSRVFTKLSGEEAIYYSAQVMNLSDSSRDEVLGSVDLNEVLDFLLSTVKTSDITAEIDKNLVTTIRKEMEDSQREYILRQKKEAIEKELGEDEEDEVKELETKLETLNASDEVKLKIKRELKRFKKLPAMAGEKGPLENYLKTMLDLPWDTYTEDNNSIEDARAILDRDHYGMEDTKERILEYMAVRNLTGKDGSGTVLCLQGPPGTGKTSIAKSLAESLGRTFHKVSLGGINDESTIRGHRRTYVGAMCGKIISAITKAGTSNPVILLDEIDKVSSNGSKGDVSAALLELLDPSQNSNFSDHYLDVDYDLSKVVFVATSNYLQNIPPALRDRLEIINISGYTSNEKKHIAKDHLLTRAKKENGLVDVDVKVSDALIETIVSGYTRESGVRGLQRTLNTICRKLATRIVLKKLDLKSYVITKEDIREFLGVIKFDGEEISQENKVGLVNGMYYSASGGGILKLSAIKLAGTGKLKITGSVKEDMKESSDIALTYVRSIAHKYDISPDVFRELDFYMHTGDISTPKSGPSASIAMMTTLISLLTGKKVNRKVAMTGESNLFGEVMPIGGVKEKILGAKLAGCDTIIIPKKNEKDLEDISDEIKEGLTIHACTEMSEVLKVALV